MSATIKDIAKMANVSRGTVDRVLNNRGSVNHEVELRIRKIALDLGYKPNRAGKALAARKKPIKIGCLLPSVDNPFFNDVMLGLRAAERELSDYGFSLDLVQQKGYDVNVHLDAIQSLVDNGADALCLTTVDVPLIIDKINELIRSGLPIATINSDVRGTSRLFYVGSNYIKGGKTAAGILSLMLKEKGKILIVTGSVKMQGHNKRIQGFCKEVKDNKYEISIVDVVESQDDDETAYLLTKESLNQYHSINSIYITAGGVAGVCRAVEELQLSKKLHIVSFDDIPVIRKAVLNGTIDATICQEPFEQGYQAIKLMFNYFIEGVVPENGFVYTNNVIKIKQNIQTHPLLSAEDLPFK
nr:LacI family DNA-binding transcriptional regulator [uncultured Caproiciproducens sp.]